jgi:hypothetical protein
MLMHFERLVNNTSPGRIAAMVFQVRKSLQQQSLQKN